MSAHLPGFLEPYDVQLPGQSSAEHEREKEREAAIQRDRQRRLKEKAYGRKTTKPRAGDIDGKRNVSTPVQEQDLVVVTRSYLGRD